MLADRLFVQLKPAVKVLSVLVFVFTGVCLPRPRQIEKAEKTAKWLCSHNRTKL